MTDKPQELWLIQRGDGLLMTHPDGPLASEMDVRETIAMWGRWPQRYTRGPYSAVRCLVIPEGTEGFEPHVLWRREVACACGYMAFEYLHPSVNPYVVCTKCGNGKIATPEQQGGCTLLIHRGDER